MTDHFKRRDVLRMAALLPGLPFSLGPLSGAFAAGEAGGFRRILVVRLAGGNDGLNALVPFRDDLYYRNRPNIALPAKSLLSLDGNDMGLHPALAEFRQLLDQGWAGIVQNVGYPQASRSHLRATEIWESGTTLNPAPDTGWLGRWADVAAAPSGPAGYDLGTTPGLMLASQSGRIKHVANPDTLRVLAGPSAAQGTDHRNSKLNRILQLESDLRAFAGEFERATGGSGQRYAYPDTEFGAALRWAANLIETRSAAQVFHVTLGSFENGFSFDTHLDQLAAHDALYSELGRGLLALARQLGAAGAWDDTLVMTYSDFGRQIMENNTGGTEHGDAGMMFIAGGRVAAGVHGNAPDLAGATDGGLKPEVDFRSILSGVLLHWLQTDPAAVLDTALEPYSLVS